jgi:Xaa-Pro dipeptidase
LNRLQRFAEILRANAFDFAALIPSATCFHITGIDLHLQRRPQVLIIAASGAVSAVLPVLELPQFEGDRLPFPIQFFSFTDAEGYPAAFQAAATSLGLAGKRIAVEGIKMRVFEGQILQQVAPGAEIISADDLLGGGRLRKDAQELAQMRQAIALSEKALEDTLQQVRIGMTERQVTSLLLRALSEHGSQGVAFDPIVLSGANAALPHGVPSDSPLREGDVLLFDFGGAIGRYPADITRTFGLGKLDAESVKIYETVKAANAAGIRAAKAGVTGQDVDRATRQVIEDAGYGEYFIHRTGHGLGLDIHEPPFMVEGYTQPLEPGMVFTIEPGIYVPGKIGVRIEDNLVITADGAEVMTAFPKTLRYIG